MNSASSSSDAVFLREGGHMGALIRAKDWTQTPLGSPESWPQALKTTLRIILTSQQPMFVWWGPDLINIYNDAYMSIIGDKHKSALGRPAREIWPEIWNDLIPRVDAVMRDNIGTYDEKMLLLMQRKGYTEETYFTFSYSPITGEDGKTEGLFCVNSDETQQVLWERQMHIMRELSKNIVHLRSRSKVYAAAFEIFEANPKDFPFSIMYEVSDDGKELKLVQKVPGDLPAEISEPVIDLSKYSEKFPEFQQALSTGKAVMIDDIATRFGVAPKRFWDNSPHCLLLLPIIQYNQLHPFALLCIGLNPYREPGSNYIGFFHLIGEQLTSALTNVAQIKAARTQRHYDKQLKDLFLQAPIAISILRGTDFIIETVNEKMVELWGRGTDQLLGKPIFEAMPDAKGQGFEEILQQVYRTGVPYIANERLMELTRNGVSEKFYVKFIYKALRDENNAITGIMALADDITEYVEVRQKIQDSETRNKLAIDAAEIGTFELNLNTSEFIYSDRFADIFGYPGMLNLKQTDFLKLIYDEDRPIRDTALRIALDTGVLFYEARFIRPNSSVIWLRINGTIIREGQNPTKIFGTVRDITDHKVQAMILEKKVAERTRNLKKKNEELKQSEERFQRMTEEVQDYAILLLDTTGKILNWNKGAEKIKGYREDEIVGRHIETFYLPEDRKSQLPQKLINEAREKGRAVHEGYRIRKDGTVFWASMALTALHDNDGNVIGFSKVTRDLTERKLAEDKIKKYNSELEFQNKELEQFAYVASHDLQEPLRKIQMFADLLERNLDDEEAVKKYFSKINSSAERMSELIKAVLNYSRLSRIDEYYEFIDLNEILRNVLTDFELLIEEKNAKIISDDMPKIKGIPLQLNQLFSNLIGNALKFSVEAPEIRIRSRVLNYEQVPHNTQLSSGSRYLELIFSDNGIGFDQKYAAQIFTIFQRLNDKSAFSGTGIGLALCKKIVENHHGHITAKSAPGQGASFQIYLPIE